MRKPITVLAAVAFSLALAAGGCAREKPPTPPRPAKKEVAKPGKKPVANPRVKLFAGTIEELDVAAGTLTLAGPKETMDFRAGGKLKKRLAELQIGDKVIVKYVDETALSIVKPRTSKSAQAPKETVVR